MEATKVSSGVHVDIRHATVYRENHPVLPDFSLEIVQGCSTVILGPNGSGKSTLMKLFLRELYPILGEGGSFPPLWSGELECVGSSGSAWCGLCRFTP